MKSANVMVSSDGGLFITDFGFATVGKFGPPPQLIEKPALGPAATASATTTDAAPKLTGSDMEEAHACDGAAPPARSRSGTADTNSSGGGKGAKTSSGRVPDGDVNGSITMPAKSKQHQAQFRASGSVAAPEEARGASSGPADQDNAGEGGDVGGNERPPNQYSVLYGTLKGYTPRYQSPEVSAIIDEKNKAAATAAAVAAAAAAAQGGGHPSPNQVPQVGFLHCKCKFWGTIIVRFVKR